MIRYLIEFIAQLNERYQVPSAKFKDSPTLAGFASPSASSTELCKKSMSLLYHLLQPQYWSDLDIDLFPHVTDAVLASDRTQTVLTADPSDKEKFDNKFITNIINTLQVVRIILNVKSDDWVQKNMSSIQKVLDKC
ncbi:hypothetical protein HYQ46_006205 [Verticillium longisporum]|nr:hypothetical protein HYQ46_006205 [Verticillium longisporum]